MTVDCFLDTNILVYAAAGRGAEETKRERSLKLIENENFGLSAQVLQEFCATVVRKIRIPLTPESAMEWIELLEAFPCLPVDSGIVKIALETSERKRLSYWDGAIIAAAEILGARTLYSRRHLPPGLVARRPRPEGSFLHRGLKTARSGESFVLEFFGVKIPVDDKNTGRFFYLQPGNLRLKSRPAGLPRVTRKELNFLKTP